MMVKKMLTMIVTSVLITLGVAVLLVVTDPIKMRPPIESLDFDAALGQDLTAYLKLNLSRCVMEMPLLCAGMVQGVSKRPC